VSGILAFFGDQGGIVRKREPSAEPPIRRTRFPDGPSGKTEKPVRDKAHNPYVRQKSGPITPDQTLSPQDVVPAPVSQASSARSVWVTLFLISIVIPLIIPVGTWRMTPYRIFLFLALFPLVPMWLSGQCGRLRLVDVSLLLFALWNLTSMFVTEGFGRLEYIGAGFIETLGGFLVGRCLVRSAADMDRFVKVMFVFMVLAMPAVVLETFFGYRLYSEFFALFGDTYPWAAYVRSGVYRAQVVFEHPILFGVFSATTFSLLYYTINPKTGRIFGLRRAWLSIVATLFSLSSGAYFGLAAQFGFIAWGWVFRFTVSRWKMLLFACVGGYVGLDLLSNRTPFELVASYMTFDAGTAYWRVLIFRYGMDNVWANPVFGLGLSNWVRPGWMRTTSVDNFWLLTAMRYGIPSFLLILTGVVSLVVSLTRCKLASEQAQKQRLALVFVLLSLFIAIATVHLWNATYVYMMFLFGCGMWMLDDDADAASTTTSARTETTGENHREIHRVKSPLTRDKDLR